MGGRHPPVIAVYGDVEPRGRARRPSGRVGPHTGDIARAQLLTMLADLLPGQDGKARKIFRALDILAADSRGCVFELVIRNVSENMIEQAIEFPPLEFEQFAAVPPLALFEQTPVADIVTAPDRVVKREEDPQ